MVGLIHTLVLFCSLLRYGFVYGTALDDYVWKVDDNYGWADLGPDYVLKAQVVGRGYTGWSMLLYFLIYHGE
jgi:hypothetical protein